ncbi:hypothetical protein BaRGS_00037947 [Batillaria attramentaria]|uniref:EF-hand domain-containing protein n=1 Tax=Batillaria attramentaria TaxID=370345 RepID=A0ABD0J846_9CAEN
MNYPTTEQYNGSPQNSDRHPGILRTCFVVFVTCLAVLVTPRPQNISAGCPQADEERVPTPAEGTEEKPATGDETVTAEGEEGANNTEGATEEETAAEGEGATEEGATEEGAAEEGATEEGAGEEGATEEGAGEEGATEEGAGEEGAAEGGAEDGDGAEAGEELKAFFNFTTAENAEEGDEDETNAGEAEGETNAVEEETTVEETQEAPELTQEERDTFEELFNLYAEEDDNGNKTIGQRGIKLLFRYAGEIVDDKTYRQWLEEEDKDGVLFDKKRKPEDTRIEELLNCVNQLFPKSSESGDDDLDLDQVAKTMRSLERRGLFSEGSVLTEDDIKKILTDMDTDNSKKISRGEFVAFLCKPAAHNGQ